MLQNYKYSDERYTASEQFETMTFFLIYKNEFLLLEQENRYDTYLLHLNIYIYISDVIVSNIRG